MSSVYLVTSGCYSDYSVLTAFSNEADAQAFVARIVDEGSTFDRDVRVESYSLDTGAEQIRAGLMSYEIVIARDTGDVDECHATANEPRDSMQDAVIWKTDESPKIPALRCTVWALDKAHAVKIASERRAAHVALGVGKARGGAP